MLIEWECSFCGYRVCLPPHYGGRTVKCPHCGRTGRVTVQQTKTEKKRFSEKREMARCPYCREVIRADARKCKHCGEMLDPVLQRQDRPTTGDALIRCVTCGGTVASSATTCPHCGRPAPTLSAPISDKSRLAAGLLGIFLGGFGVHRFYLGYIGIGIIQLVLTLVTFGFAGIWGFIEGIVILAAGMKDAKGRSVVRW